MRKPSYPRRPMALTPPIIVPTRGAPGYLDVALASIAPQAADAGAELIVVDDGAGRRDARRRRAPRRALRRPRAPARAQRRAQQRRSTPTDAELLVLRRRRRRGRRPAGSPRCSRRAAELPDDVGVLTGPIRARIEGRRCRAVRARGRADHVARPRRRPTATPRAWGANMAIRRSAIERVGRFDEPAAAAGARRRGGMAARAARAPAAGSATSPAAGVDHRRARRRRAPALALRARPYARGREPLRRYDAPGRRAARWRASCARSPAALVHGAAAAAPTGR